MAIECYTEGQYVDWLQMNSYTQAISVIQNGRAHWHLFSHRDAN